MRTLQTTLARSPMAKRVLSNTSWLASEKLITMCVALALSVFLARALGPSDWGRLNYLLAIVAMLGPFTSLGLNAIITREIVNAQKSSEDASKAISKIIATALVYRLIGGVIGSLICALVCITFIDISGAELGLVISLLFASLFSAGQVVEFWFQAQMLNRYVATLRLVVFLLFAFLKILAVMLAVEFWQLLLLFAAEILTTGLAYLLLYSIKHQAIKFKSVDFVYGWRLLKQSLWLVMSGLAAVLYLKVDQIMLANMLNDQAVGVYSVAVRLSEVWFFFPAAFAASVFPVLLKSRGQDNQAQAGSRYQRDLQVSCDVLLGSALLVTLSVCLLAPYIVPLLFGNAYVDSASVLIIHIWGCVFVFMRALASKWLVSESLLPYSLWSHGLGAVINISLNLFLIPLYGIWGAAWSTVIAYVFSGYVCFWMFPKTQPIALVMSRSLLMPFNWHKSFRSVSR